MLTVVIWTRNRPDELRELVRYWSKWPVSLVILDGSDVPIADVAWSSVASRVLVCRDVSRSVRLDFAASNIETPYACLHADDNFLLARAGAKAIAFLENHNEFASICGDAMSFTADGLVAPDLRGREIVGSDGRARLSRHFANYGWSYVYGIHRTAQLTAMIEAASAANQTRLYEEYPSPEVGLEFAFEIAGSLLGQMGNAGEVLVLKEVGNQGVSETLQQRWPDWLRDSRASSARVAWRAVLSDRLAPRLGESPATVDGWIANALDSLLKFGDPWANPREKGFTGTLRHLYRARIPRNPDSDYVLGYGLIGLLKRMHLRSYRVYRRTSRRIRRVHGVSASERLIARHRAISDTDCADSLDIQDFKVALAGREINRRF